jgi:hypothetical protein
MSWAAARSSRHVMDTLDGPGYSIWKFCSETVQWSMIVDHSRPGHAPAPAPKGPGKFHGEILRLISILGDLGGSR